VRLIAFIAPRPLGPIGGKERPISHNQTPAAGKSHFSRGNVAHVTFREPRFSHQLAAIALALSQKSHIANFVIRPPFLGHPFFPGIFQKNVQ
jgi:hypothetical protein